MPFEPYPLLNFEQGLFEAKEPWISPETSFRELRNFRLKNGRLVKREGYTDFGCLGISVSGEVVGDGGGSDIEQLDHVPFVWSAWLDDEDDTYSVTFTDPGTNVAKAWRIMDYEITQVVLESRTDTITPESGKRYTGQIMAINNPRSEIEFYDSGTGQTATVTYIVGPQLDGGSSPIEGDVEDGATNTWTHANKITGLGTYDFEFDDTPTGTVTVTYDKWIGLIAYNGLVTLTYANPPWGNPVTASYEYPSGNPVMGIKAFYTLDGNEYLVVGDTVKIWRYNTTTKRFADPVGSLNGDDSQFLHFCPFENILVINNGTDAPKKYTPATPAITDMGTNFDAAGGNDIQAARFCFRHKSRLVYFRTKESSVDYAQRARWTPVNDVEYDAATGDEAEYYVDAPTTERIVAVEMVGDDFVVLFDRSSIWRLRYVTPDPFNAFEWERIDTTEGTTSPMGHVSLGKALLYRGQDGIKLTDAREVIAADVAIPDKVLTWNAGSAKYSTGVYIPSTHEAMISFADSGETYPEHALVAHLDPNRKIKGYSIYDLPFHCFGHYRSASVPTWDEATAGLTVDEIMWAPDDLLSSVEFPIVLAGGRDSYIYQYADGYSDNGADVEAICQTIRLNPYRFRKCHLGYIDIIAYALTETTVTLYLTKDYDASPYEECVIDLTPPATEEKISRRARINRTATFHTIRLSVSSSTSCAIDALVLWCKPAGPMRQIA